VVTHAANVEIAEYLRQNLPEYMVPAVWQELDALPLTTNGKVNRKALPSVARPQSIHAQPAEPQPDALTRISALIAQELALPSVDPAKNLLTLGATSMDLVRIVGRLQKELGFRPSFQEFLRDPSAAPCRSLSKEQRRRDQGRRDSPGAGATQFRPDPGPCGEGRIPT
jgi:acyl carrier protein